MRILEISFIVPFKYSGFRIDNLLSILFPGLTRSSFKDSIINGFLFINNFLSFLPSSKVFYEDKVMLFFYSNNFLVNNYVLNLIYKDNYILIFNKKKNLIIFPSKKNFDGSFFYSLLKINLDLYSLPRFGIVHRLDKDTTGIFILANSLSGFYKLIKQFKYKKIKRVYKAVVFGVSCDSRYIEIPLKNFKLKMIPNLYGKKAITFFEILKKFKNYMYIKINLLTGKKHQIRSHMNYIKHGIVGDKLYYNKDNLDSISYDFIKTFPRQALHAKELFFLHPKQDKKFYCLIRLPNDINNLLYLLNKFN